MKKLSIKLKLPDPAAIIANLKLGTNMLGDEYAQFDRVFLPRNWQDHYEDIDQAPHLLIRTTTANNQHSHMMIMKRIISDEVVYFYQTQIMDYNQTAHIINNMGYELYNEISKKRRKMVSGSIVAYLDKVDGVDGWFFKLEKNLKDHESENSDELWDVIIALKLQHAERAPRYNKIIKR